MPTLEEIARLAGSSRSTVSRVVNNDPNVSERTRQRIQQVIQQANFHPNRAARSLAGGRTHVLGLVIPAGVARLFTDPYFSILIQGVSSACNAADHSVMLWLAEPEDERRMIAQIVQNGLIDGAIVASTVLGDPLLRRLEESGLPTILIGRPQEEAGVSFVDVDNREGARRLTAHLLARGCRRVATITGPLDMIAGSDRFAGYRAALAEAGLAIDPALVVEGDFSEAGGQAAALQLLSHRPEAIFAASDSMAAGALRALRTAGLSVPADVALAGFDDLPLAAHTDPPLTTVRQPIHRCGVLAVETLIERIEHPDQPPHQILLPTELVLRESG